MPHLYLIMTFNRQTCSIPNTAHFKNQAKLQHCDDQLTLLSLHHISLEYYLPWHPGGDLQLTWQRRRSSSTSSFWCQNHSFLMPWDRQNSLRWTLSISKCSTFFSVTSPVGWLRGWGPTLLDSSCCHLIIMTDTKRGWQMTYLPLEWIFGHRIINGSFKKTASRGHP